MSQKKSPTKSALAFIKDDPTVYQERSDAGKRESVALLIRQGIADYDGGIEDMREGGRCFVRALNRIAEAGRKFQTAAEIGQFEFRLFECDLEGWRKEYDRKQKIKIAIKIHTLIPNRVEKFSDITPAIQMGLLASGLVDVGRRLGNETEHAAQIPLNAFLSDLVNVQKWLTKMEPPDAPVDDYYAHLSVDTLREIERSTKPIAERHAIVERLLKEKAEA